MGFQRAQGQGRCRLERAREAQDDFLERVLEIEHRIISAHKNRADYLIDKQYRVVDLS